MTALPPIHREIIVDAAPERAFEVFTDDIGRWWPVAEHSVHGAGSTVSFDGGRIIERAATGEEAVWGTVTGWEPGRLVSFTWHPGHEPARASSVSVSFHAIGERTLVVLKHSGWEAFTDPESARTEYGRGWPKVLRRFSVEVASDDAYTWVALVHSPGPSVAEGTSVFADPRFPLHLAFLDRMGQSGYLVAAGPLGDAEGDGMTILRLPGQGRHDEVARMAAEEDGAVVEGLFEVRVRPWRVMLHAVELAPSE